MTVHGIQSQFSEVVPVPIAYMVYPVSELQTLGAPNSKALLQSPIELGCARYVFLLHHSSLLNQLTDC